MQVRRLSIQNFRGIKNGTVNFDGDTLLVGGNNTGKSTICEALDLVLGPERLYRRPVVNEHDFYKSKYLDEDGKPIEIRIEAVLVDLSEEAERRFRSNLRRWNEIAGRFVDEHGTQPESGDAEGTCWALPVLFVGYYDPDEDDFIGRTFLAHPQREIEELEKENAQPGTGLQSFTPKHKKLCGFLYLRALRTGSRALSLQRGSLLDTILRVSENGLDKMWQETLERLRNLSPAIGEIGQLKKIREEIQARVSQFVNLASGESATVFFASDLTRQHLREVVRFFVASEQSDHLVPFQRQGTGAINMLVFALLTFIAESKEKQAVIFAMEEPEIALPPHTQRRVVRYVLREMGQTIVTSHSPYVIEQFEPDQIVMLKRDTGGILSSKSIDTTGIKPKTFKSERKQFAEAVLSRAVLVVEGSTEAAIFPEASSILEQVRGSQNYTHFDLAGLTVFDTGGDGSVPRYGPVFKSLGKLAFGFYDKQKEALSVGATKSLGDYTQHWESPHTGIENLLVEEIPAATIRRFLDAVKERPDYPTNNQKPNEDMNDTDIKKLARSVLMDRKGGAHAYGALLIAECKTEEELPASILTVLDKIQEILSPPIGTSKPENEPVSEGSDV